MLFKKIGELLKKIKSFFKMSDLFNTTDFKLSFCGSTKPWYVAFYCEGRSLKYLSLVLSQTTMKRQYIAETSRLREYLFLEQMRYEEYKRYILLVFI